MPNMIHNRIFAFLILAVAAILGLSMETGALAGGVASILWNVEPITPIPAPPAVDRQKLALGESLFDDPRLSADGTRSCSSCHDLRENGADGRAEDVALGGQALQFNTPTVFNAALNFKLDWEGNYKTLEDQAKASIESPQMMGGDMPNILRVMRSDRDLRQRFETIYGHEPDENALLNALATFERSLLTPGSRFDLWLEGDSNALSSEEKQGYQLFKAEGCVSCHQGVNVGGNLFEHSGIFHPLIGNNSPLLRVPSLRNVAVTAPYFHDGSVPTLDEAVRRMASAQLGEQPSSAQVQAIVAFLRTLTGTYHGKPLTAASP